VLVVETIKAFSIISKAVAVAHSAVHTIEIKCEKGTFERFPVMHSQIEDSKV